MPPSIPTIPTINFGANQSLSCVPKLSTRNSAQEHHSDTLWLAIHLPLLPLEVFALDPITTPTVVYDTSQRSHSIVAVDDHAQRHGIITGMPLSVAHAQVTGLCAFIQNCQAEQQTLVQLATQATHWSPNVVVHSSGLLLEIAGSLRLYGGLNSLLAAIKSWIKQQYSCVHLAITPTPSSAMLCARHSNSVLIVNQTRLVASISQIPVNLLELNPHQQTLLQQIGIRQIGALLRLPRSGLARRLGPAILNMLDRLTGVEPEPQITFIPPRRFEKTLECLPARTQVEQLMPWAKILVQTLVSQLLHTCKHVNQIDWSLHHADQPSTPITLRLTDERYEEKSLLGLTRLAFDTINLTAAVEKITLSAMPLRHIGEQNACLFSATHMDTWPMLLDRLRHRLGDQQVLGLRTHAEYRPEHAWSFCEPGETDQNNQCAPRPLWLFLKPRILDVIDGNPYFHGPLEVAKEYERIVSGWWDTFPVRRDYYHARNNHHIDLWIFRELNTGHWFAHGIF